MSPVPATHAAARRLKAQRAALKAKLKKGRSKDPNPNRRRWLVVLAVLLLLLLLLRQCPEEEPALVAGAPEPSGPAVVSVPEPPVPPPAPIADDRLKQRDRPAYESDDPGVLPWITSFRLQVAARSPRLAECFIGAARPGRLKWTAAVEPTSGQVSEHALEPTLQSDALTQDQRRCALKVLSDPPYRLQVDGRATPSRVSMVIEF